MAIGAAGAAFISAALLHSSLRNPQLGVRPLQMAETTPCTATTHRLSI